MALTRVTSGGIAPGIVIKFDSDNTPTNPALAFDNSNDDGTGMYQPATNEIAFSTSGVERLRIKGDGQIISGNGTILGGTNPDFDNAINVIMYVNQSDKNATDSAYNDGGNLNKPFKTIERALIEASRKSYVSGADDRFEAYTIMVMPGDYTIDNRPGYDVVTSPVTDGTYTATTATYDPATGLSVITVPNHGFSNGDRVKLSVGSLTFTCALDNDATQHSYPRVTDPAYDTWLSISNVTTNTFTVDVGETANVADRAAHTFVSATTGGILHEQTSFEANLYRFNPRNGGVIVPRGTSVVGYDLRKTVIRPKFVPTPNLDGGAIDGDSYQVSAVNYDAANIIEKCRGYIQEQAWLHIKNTYPSESDIDETCKRDIGYFIDSVIRDLREGGNANTFIAGEYYTNGSTTINLGDNNSTERTAAIAAYNKARDIMKAALDYDIQSQWNNNGNGTSTHGDTTLGSYYTELTSITAGSTTYSKTVWRPDINNNVDYTGNETSANECAEARDAVDTLTLAMTTIVGNPDTYNDLIKKTVPVAHQTAIFKVTGGCYFWQMTFKDAKSTPTVKVQYDGSGVPTFTEYSGTWSLTPDANGNLPNAHSHHRVVSFTYADQRTTDGELERYYKRIDAWDTAVDGGNNRVVRTEEFQIVGDSSSTKTIDTVNSCSPYIFNCSLRSVLGLNGMHTDGSKVKANSFKSMVVAQFTGISLQKDPNAYWQPRNKTGKVYTSGSATNADNDSVVNNPAVDPNNTTQRGPVYADPDAEYRHDWRHFHIKASNSAFIQVVSVFAVGYADQFLAVNGGDMSITNSNSNFGQISLRAAGHKFQADPPSAFGKITALIPPAGISKESQYTELYPIATDTTWEVNLGETATKDETSWASSKTRFSTSGNSFFKLYFEIPGVTKEDEIPELVVESKDLNGGTTAVKRFLTYGSGNNYNLFREYYNTSGVLSANDCVIVNQVDGEGGGLSTYEATVSVATPVDDNETKNHERVGYKWDRVRQKVYVELDSTKSNTRTYVADFIFADIVETTFVTETVTNDDGSTSVISTTKDVNVLEYWEGFPGSVTTAKLLDQRASTPNDLLWRVKYVIPKNYVNADGQSITPKPPEKRFIIKGTSPQNDKDGVPYTNYRFTVWDVQEVQTWQAGVRDGEYYLTILRADIDKFIDGEDGTGYENTPHVLQREDNNDIIIADRLSELSFDDRNYRVSSNVNYLYPSTNEEGNIGNPRVIWNPPQTDSRVIVEQMPGDTASNANYFGFRPKDVSVPNKKYYKSNDNATPFHEIPALTSLTAEACHRLVKALDLCYIKSTAGTEVNVKVAPVSSWDDRASDTSNYSTVSTSFNVYGNATASQSYRVGQGTSTITDQNSTDANKYGFALSDEERKIPVCSATTATISGTHDSVTGATPSNHPQSIAPVVPLLRPSILRASSHTWEYIGIGPGNYSTGFPNLQTRVLKAYEQFIAQGYENAGGFVASSGTNSAGDFYIGNQVIQAGGQSTTTLNVPKVRKSSESNAVDVSDLENRIANNVINVIASPNKSSAQQNLLKGLSNFFTTARLTVTDRANIQTLYVTDRMFIANNSILNGEKFPEGGPEGYGFTKGARPEKTGYIATDTNDRLYVSPKFLDAWRIKKKILSATNINLDNNRVYIEPLSRTFTSAKINDTTLTTALAEPITFTGSINGTGGLSSVTLTGQNSGSALNDIVKVGMRVSQTNRDKDKIKEEAVVTSVTSTSIQLEYVNPDTTATFASGSSINMFAVDQLELVDTSGMPPFGRIDVEQTLDHVTSKDYIEISNVKYYLNPVINISLQYDEVDYTTNTISVSTSQNFASYEDYVNSVLPEATQYDLHTIIRNYPSVTQVINDSEELLDPKYLYGALVNGGTTGVSATVSSTVVGEGGTETDSSGNNGVLVNIATNFHAKLPSRGAVTFRKVVDGETQYSTFVYVKRTSPGISLLRKVTTQSNNDTGVSYSSSDGSEIYFSGSVTYSSYGDKWTVENAFIPDVEEISEDVDIESATLYELPNKPVPFTGRIDETYTEGIVPNPVTSKALGANLQTKRTVKTFQPFENLKQVADFAQDAGFTQNDTVEIMMKPGYYRLYSNSDSEYTSQITFPCQLKINGSGSKKTDEQYSKELANEPAGRIGGYSNKTVKSGDSVSFYRSPQFRNNWGGRTDLLYINNIGDRLESTGGIDINNVHFLGINEAITRNEILDNAYSTDDYTVAARRRVRKAWYVKESKDFDNSSSANGGVDGGMSFQTKYTGTAQNGQGSFEYFINSTEITEDDRDEKAPTVDTITLKSPNARYIKFKFERTKFTSNETRFNQLTEYVIPGTTVYYFPNQSGQTQDASTKRTRVIDVKKNTTTANNVTTIDSIEVICALFEPSNTSRTKGDADMDLSDIGMLDAGVSSPNSLTSGIQLIFANRNGDEFCTLTYNWCKQKRNQIVPKSMSTSGEGFDDSEYDIPVIFGIVAGYKSDTINLVIDTNPSKDSGGIRSFSRSGSANGSSSTTSFTLTSSSTGVSTSGSGSGATFKIDIIQGNGGFYRYDVTVEELNAGTGYAVDDTVTILGTALGGTTPTNDLTLTIGSLYPAKKQYPATNLFTYYPSISIYLTNSGGTHLSEEYSVTIPGFANGYRRLYGRQDTRYVLFEVKASEMAALGDNDGMNGSVKGQFSGFGYQDINFNEGSPDITVGDVTFTPKDRRRTKFDSDQQFEAIAKYNLSQAGTGYRQSGSGLTTIGRRVTCNYAKNYKVNRKKFPTSTPPTVGNLGATLIKVSGVPGTSNTVKLVNCTIGAMSDANDRSNTYGGGYHGGLIAIDNGTVSLQGVRFRGNLSLDWSGLLTDGGSRLSTENRFTYGHSVDLVETAGIINISKLGNNAYKELNVSKEDINYKYYTMYRNENNLYIEPNQLPTGEIVDYDSRTFPINTVNAIPKFNSTGGWNETVDIYERFLTDKISTLASPSGDFSGRRLRFNNSSGLVIRASDFGRDEGGHTDGVRDLQPKTITFELPYNTTTNEEKAEEVAKNIIPNFTEIIRNGNKDSVLGTVTSFEFYKKTGQNIAVFEIGYSGNVQYEGEDDMRGMDDNGTPTGDFDDFELQFLTKYIPSQRFNYVSTLTTRYIKRSNADSSGHSKYELGFDEAQNQSIFANSKDFAIQKLGSGVSVSREASGAANIINFRKAGTTGDNDDNDVRVILQTNIDNEVASCSIVSLGINNAQDDVLYYNGTTFTSVDESTFNGFKITMLETTSARTSDTDTNYDMFAPGEVVNNVENASFLVNNFRETNLTSIKGELQRIKSIISPGSYIEYGGQYYKVAYSLPGRPYLGIHQYANPVNAEDIRTSLVVRLEETSYEINYTKKRGDEVITRFDLYEDDNVLRYWPTSGRAEIGELELCSFTKTYVDDNQGYKITLNRSNTDFWPSYIHDWDGLEIATAFEAGDSPTDPTEAVPGVATGTVKSTPIKLADPVDTTASTYKRVKSIGYTSLDQEYLSKEGIKTQQRAFVDIYSSDNQLDQDIEKYEVGQIVSLPWRNLGVGSNNRGYDNGTEYTDKYHYAPANIKVTVIAAQGDAGLSGSTNRLGDARISAYVTTDQPAYADIKDTTDKNDGHARLTNNLNSLHHIVQSTNTWTSGKTTHNIYDSIDPLTLIRGLTSFSTILGKPHADNNASSSSDNNATLVSGSTRKFTIAQGGDADIGKGLVPGISILNVTGATAYWEEDTTITSVTRSGTAPNCTYTILANKEPETALPANFPVAFDNRRYLEFELFNPLLGNLAENTEFQIVPQFNTEGHPWRRHNEIFQSRISDIQKLTSAQNGNAGAVIRLHLSDPFDYGSFSDNGKMDLNTYYAARYGTEQTNFITSAESRYFGFISINHGGWTFPRSGASYLPSNMARIFVSGGTGNSNKISLPNYSGRILAGDSFAYTYEASKVVQQISRDSYRDTNKGRFYLRGISVEEGDTLSGFDVSSLNNIGVYDRFKNNGTYNVFHVRYENTKGEETDSYTFGNANANSFWDGATFSEDQPITKYRYSTSTNIDITSLTDGSNGFFVDIGGGVSNDGTANYSNISGDATAIETALNDDFNDDEMGVYDVNGATQQSADPWRKSLVRSSSKAGVGCNIGFRVINNTVEQATILAAGTGYEVDDYILVEGAVFSFDNPRYPKDVYFYISDVDANGGVLSFEPRLVLESDSYTSPNDGGTKLYARYDASAAKFLIQRENSGTLTDLTSSDPHPFRDADDSTTTAGSDGIYIPDNSIFIDTTSGSIVYLAAQVPTLEGELIDFNFNYQGGFTNGMKLIFAKPKPSLKRVTGTVVTVGNPGSDGYSDVTLDSPDNILFKEYPDTTDWISVSDIQISHTSDLFAKDGAVCKRIFHSEKGGTMEFNDYNIWNDWYRQGSQNKGYGIYGSHGWVGNWGRLSDGSRPIGFTSLGSLTVNWGRQRANSIWKTAQPVRPIWTHRGVTTNVNYNGAAFTPAQRYFYTNGTNSFFSSSFLNYLPEDNQVFDRVAYGNPINHITSTSDAIRMSLSTSKKFLREDWWSGRYYDGGFGSVTYQPHQWASTFDAIAESRITVPNRVSYQLQDLSFRKNDYGGNINWGSGRKTRLAEQITSDYIQHYSAGPLNYDATNAADIFVDAGIRVRLSDRSSTDKHHKQTLVNKNASNTVTGNLRKGKLYNVGDTAPAGIYSVETADSGLPQYARGSSITLTTDLTVPGSLVLRQYKTQIARGDQIYLRKPSSPTAGLAGYIYVGQVRYVSGGAGENDTNEIILTENLPTQIDGETMTTTTDYELYYYRPQGLKTHEYEFDKYAPDGSSDGLSSKVGESVVSAGMAGSHNYNMSVIINKRNYNTSPTNNTLNTVKAVGNYWWYWGSSAAHKSIRVTAGDLSGLNWSQMNVMITRFNPKVHLEQAVTITSNKSTIAVNNVYI